MWRNSAALSIVLILAGCQRYPTGGDIRIRSDMVDQPSFRPQEDPRPLPEQIVPVRDFDPPLSQQEAERLTNPVPPGQQALAEGGRLFEIYCAPCHGTTGRGDGPVAAKISRPANLQAPKYAQAPDGFFYYVIRDGAPMMPPMREAVKPHERWLIIHYLRTLQKR